MALTDLGTQCDQADWDGLLGVLPAWNALIEEFNTRSGTAAGA